MKKSKLLFVWLSKEKEIVAKIYILALFQGLLYFLLPLGIQGIVTFTMAGRFSASLVLLSIVAILITFFIGLFQLWQMRINETMQESIFARLADKIEKYLGENKKESLMGKINYFFEVVTLQKGIAKILLDFSFSVISVVFGLLILPAYSSWFLIFTVFFALVFYFIVSYFGKKAIDNNVALSKIKYHLFDSFSEITKGIDTKDNNNDEILGDYLNQRKSYYEVLEKQYKSILFFKVFFVAILLFLGSYLVQIGELNIGQFVASEIIILLVINAVEKIVINLGTCYDIITALYKIESIFSDKPETSFLNDTEKPIFKSVANVYNHHYSKATRVLLYGMLLTFTIILFLPWTQNIESKGYVSTLNPDNKPQKIATRISGRLEKWYIKDGDFVKKNDTIAFISEIKDDYMDTQLLSRTESQVKSKETSIEAYEDKLNAIDKQIDILTKSMGLKMSQFKNKVIQSKFKVNSDSIEAIASANNYHVAEDQFKRYEDLLQKGIISRTDLENRKVKLQEALSKKIAAFNKLSNAKNEVLNAEIELNSCQQEYNEKLMKAESDKFSTLSMIYDAEGGLTKLQNQLSNYSMRQSYYYVLAPQDGYINKIVVQGVGEIVKEGGTLCTIVPSQKEQVAELYVEPIDLPLIQIGTKVQLTFDGWPAFVFSGWPGMSYGTYTSEIIAFDKTISENGKFRVLVRSTSQTWPTSIQIGSGVKGFALLNNVPLVYELWRKANGFPPEFYTNSKGDYNEKK